MSRHLRNGQSGRSLIGFSVTLATLVVLAAGVLALSVGTARAHHNTITESANCNGWLSKAGYSGGSQDRKVVVDVTIDGEHISQTFYFNNGAGHLGHPSTSYNLYTRSGDGAVDTSGTITMYSKQGGSYSKLEDTDHPNLHFTAANCATPTHTATATATRTSTPTKTSTLVPTSTNTATPVHTSTPTANLDIDAGCDDSGGITGTITGIPGPYPRVFDIFVTDHKPGEGFFLEIPGSRVTVSAGSSTLVFGPLDISNVRDGVNTIRVEQTLSNAKSVSFKPCEAPTPTPTNTPEPTSTNTPEPTSTNTPEPTSTNTPEPTSTNTPEPTSTNTPEPTETNTPEPTETNTPEPTSTNTPEPTSTNTPEPTETNTPEPTETNTPEPTETNTPEPTSTNTPEPTSTNTPEPTSTNTPVPTSTNTPVPTATNTPKSTTTPRVRKTHTPVPTATSTRTVAPSPSATATKTFGRARRDAAPRAAGCRCGAAEHRQRR